jgi:hypothetical protein
MPRASANASPVQRKRAQRAASPAPAAMPAQAAVDAEMQGQSTYSQRPLFAPFEFCCSLQRNPKTAAFFLARNCCSHDARRHPPARCKRRLVLQPHACPAFILLTLQRNVHPPRNFSIQLSRGNFSIQLSRALTATTFLPRFRATAVNAALEKQSCIQASSWCVLSLPRPFVPRALRLLLRALTARPFIPRSETVVRLHGSLHSWWMFLALNAASQVKI